MESINISLPDEILDYIEEQINSGGYRSVNEYFCKLVLQDQKRKANERLEAMVLEGINSGTPTEMTSQNWEEIRTAVRQRIAKRKESK